MADFHLIRPWFLLSLLPVLVAVFVMLRRQKEGEAWLGMIDSNLLEHLLVGEGKNQRIKPVYILCGIWILAAVALAGPSWRKQPSPFSDDQAGLVVILKMSGSMEADDVQPSRLERAKFKMRDLLEQRSGAASALIVYSGSAHLVMPLTKDDTIINTMAEGLTPAVMPAEGDALAAALILAEKLLLEAGVPGSALVIADRVDPTQITQLDSTAADLPVQFLSIQPPQSPSDAGILAAAKSRGSELIVMTESDEDVEQANKVAQSKMLAVASDDGSERWQDSGYWLLPLILIGAAFWSRKGWKC